MIRKQLARLRDATRDVAMQRLAQNAGWLLAAEVVATLVGLVQFPLVARLLGVEGFGALHIVLSWVRVLGALLTIRVRETVVKYLSDYAGDSARSLAVLKLTYGIEIVLSVFVFALVSSTAGLAANWLAPEAGAADLIRLEAFRHLLLSTSAASTAALRVFDRFRWLSILNVVSALVTFVLVVGVLLAGCGVAGYILAFTLVTAGQTIALYQVCGRELRKRFVDAWQRADLRVLRPQRRAIGVMLFSMNLDALRKVATENADILILGAIAAPYQVGLYRLAKQLAGYVSRLTNPLFITLYPEIARIYNTEGLARLGSFVRRLTGGTVLALVVLIAGALLLARPLVPALFGSEYAPAIPLFYIIMFMHVWLIFIWAPGLLLTLGKARQLTTINVISSSAMLLLLLVLVPLWKHLGAAIALVSNFVLWTVLIAWYLSKLVPDQRKVCTMSKNLTQSRREAKAQSRK